MYLNRRSWLNKIDTVLKMLEDHTPFALTRFNDGEMMAIKQVNSIIARGDQVVDKTLQSALLSAIHYEQKNYWVGLPCQNCFPVHSNIANVLVRPDYPYKTSAVVLTNRNLAKVLYLLPKVLEDKSITYIGGEEHKIENLPLRTNRCITLPMKQAWCVSLVDNIVSTTFHDGEITLIACGPTSRILTHKLFQKYPQATFIDIGSLYDPLTRDIWHRCHLGTLPYCRVCN